MYYYFADHLGSTRVVTNSSASPCYEADYLPYGSEDTPAGFSNTCSTNYRFTGYERDAETSSVTGKGSMTLSIGYIKDTSAAWIGSLFGHEGQHYLNSGKYSGANLWKDEQSAGRTQLGIGNKIGFSSSERIHLEQWIDDRNRAAMQQHMEQGYQY